MPKPARHLPRSSHNSVSITRFPNTDNCRSGLFSQQFFFPSSRPRPKSHPKRFGHSEELPYRTEFPILLIFSFSAQPTSIITGDRKSPPFDRVLAGYYRIQGDVLPWPRTIWKRTLQIFWFSGCGFNGERKTRCLAFHHVGSLGGSVAQVGLLWVRQV